MKSVLVTGGASGMGKAVCECLAENGYFVYSLDINKCNTDNKNIKHILADVTSFDSLQNAYNEISKETEKIDAIINFAGIIMMNSLIEISEKEFEKIFNINLFGVYRVNKIFLPLIMQNKGKIIINVKVIDVIKPSVYETKNTTELAKEIEDITKETLIEIRKH